jgi:hypothetical protein
MKRMTDEERIMLRLLYGTVFTCDCGYIGPDAFVDADSIECPTCHRVFTRRPKPVIH